MKVLVVDDDEDQLEMVRRMLASYGCEVRVTSSPIGVTNVVREFLPDVVLLDVDIPALSGDKLVKLLRKRSSSRLVLFSASDPEDLRRLSREVGADAWIQKGISGKQLADRLHELCGIRR